MEFVKSVCEKTWAEIQADSYIDCRGCAKMKELEVELEQLRLLVVAMVGREQVGCASVKGGEQYITMWGKTMREMQRRAHFS